MSSPSSSLATWILHVLGRQTFLHSHPEVFSKGYHQHCARTSWVIRSYLFAAATSKEPNLQYLTITNPKHKHTATLQLPLCIFECCMHTLYLSFSVGAYFQVDSCQCLQSLFVACQFVFWLSTWLSNFSPLWTSRCEENNPKISKASTPLAVLEAFSDVTPAKGVGADPVSGCF